ncbi:unnamed protein product [Cuscuta campestris]|uniref:Reverse transcriptase domain-containing protein n=1 Tax=Cuscuta campestris TaxID=132261 RepID=A0A484MMK1_9ASTE|nr:unnamed protein product [Cuscuta campestris]
MSTLKKSFWRVSGKKTKKKVPTSPKKKGNEDETTKETSLETDAAAELKGKEKAQTSSSTSENSPQQVEEVVDSVAQVGITSALVTPHVLDEMPQSDKITPKPTTFADLFKGNRDPDQGMTLKHYDVGEGVLRIPDSIIKPVEDIWGFCLVVCFTGRFPGLKAVDAIVKSCNTPCRIIPHCKGWVVLKFENDKDRYEVLGMERSKAYGKEFRLKIPSHGFMFDFAEFTTLPVWIQLHNVPMQLWSEEGIGMLASKVGKPLRTDLVTKQLGKSGFCRVLVEVDFSQEPVTKFEVECMGKTYVQTVVFEEEPRYCFHCLTWNHSPFNCRALELIKKKELDKPVVQTKLVSKEWVPIGKSKGVGGHIEPKGGSIPSSSHTSKNLEEPHTVGVGVLSKVPVGTGVGGAGLENRKKKVQEGAPVAKLEGFVNAKLPSWKGSFFTWHKGNKFAKLDRVLINNRWGDNGWVPSCDFLDFNMISDHCPLLFQCGSPSPRRSKPFRFFNMWIKHETFQGLVLQYWQPPVLGSKQFSLCSKLKRLKHPLKSLNNNSFSHISNRAKEAKQAYFDVMKELMINPNDQALLDNAEIKRKQANFFLDAELEFYQQKAKCDFLMKADKCTSYFHSLVNKNRRKNAIPFLVKGDGSKTTSLKEVSDCFLEYYTALFGNASNVEPINHEFLTTGPSVPASAYSSLLATVTMEEVRRVVYEIGSDKAPGPDGYTAAFFKTQWDIVGQDVYGAVLEFFNTGKLLKQLNHAMIVLIPKTTHNPSGRSLVDNFLLAQHLVRDYAVKRSVPSCMIKLDITKAYDTVSWRFLEAVMVGLGFPTRFISLIMECVTTASYSIMVNGEGHGFFKSKRGLRQGDPMAPTLFLFCIEYFSRMLNTKAKEGVFSYHKDCASLGITHLAFADDIMLFSKGDFHSVQTLMQSLDHLSSVSGLTLNPAKSNIFIAGKFRDTSQNLAPFPRGQLPVRYLGLPLASQRISEADFAPLFKTVDGFLSKWGTLKLSYAGKLELIRAVIQGVQSFWLQAFPVQKYVLHRITSLCRDFLWGSKFAKVAWADICKPKGEGGLGLRDANIWNNALLCKLLWNLATKKDSLWVKWVHNVYIKHDNVWLWQPKKRHSVLLKRIAYVRELLVQKLDNRNSSLEAALQTFCIGDNLIPSKVYDFLRAKTNPKPWMAFIWHSTIPPKCSFTMWLAFRRRLRTKTNLEFLGIPMECALCGVELEEIDHLFFDCWASKIVWGAIKEWLRVDGHLSTIDRAVRWLKAPRRGDAILKKARKVALACTVFHIWK